MLKCTSFFTLGNQGWSETWFHDNISLSAAQTALATLSTARLRMCPATVTLIATRVSIVENPAVFSIKKFNSSGTYVNSRDITNMAIFWYAVTDDYTRRQIITRGTPDEVILNGVYTPTSTFSTAVVDWANAVGDNDFKIRTVDRSNPLFDVQTIDGTGNMVTYADYGWDKPDLLKFFRARFDDGTPLKRQFKIGTRTDGTHYHLIGWPAGKTVTNVRARKLVYILKKPTTIFSNLAGSRKTGRPFGLRAGRRRVTAA